MRIVKLPNGEYFLQKGKKVTDSFIFPVRKRLCGTGGKYEYGTVATLNTRTPKELIGKKIMFKVIVCEK